MFHNLVFWSFKNWKRPFIFWFLNELKLPDILTKKKNLSNNNFRYFILFAFYLNRFIFILNPKQPNRLRFLDYIMVSICFKIFWWFTSKWFFTFRLFIQHKHITRKIQFVFQFRFYSTWNMNRSLIKKKWGDHPKTIASFYIKTQTCKPGSVSAFRRVPIIYLASLSLSWSSSLPLTTSEESKRAVL